MGGVMTATTTRTDVSPWLVGIAVLGGFAAWAVRFTIGYLLVPTACEIGAWTLHLVHGITTLLAIGTVVLPLLLLKRADENTTRFLLLLAIALNVFFLAAILLESSSAFLVDACAKGAIP
jgi:uncharacterized membrane protein